MNGLAPISAAAIAALLAASAPAPGPSPSAPAQPAQYDLIGAFDSLLPGYVFSPGDWNAMYAAWQANGFAPLNQAQALALCSVVHGGGGLPAQLTSIKRVPGIDDAPIWMRGGSASNIAGAAA